MMYGRINGSLPSPPRFHQLIAPRPLDRQPQLDRIVWGMNQVLFRAEIAFRRLNRCVAEEQLDLLKLATAGTA